MVSTEIEALVRILISSSLDMSASFRSRRSQNAADIEEESVEIGMSFHLNVNIQNAQPEHVWPSGFISSAAVFRSYRCWKACLYQVPLILTVIILKPLLTATHSRSMSRDPDELANIIGIMQALISVFLDDRDKLRCINAGKTRINFLVRSPIYYASVSSWGEPESVVSMCQIVSSTHGPQRMGIADYEKGRHDHIWSTCIFKS